MALKYVPKCLHISKQYISNSTIIVSDQSSTHALHSRTGKHAKFHHVFDFLHLYIIEMINNND